jgi:hypothetical protein
MYRLIDCGLLYRDGGEGREEEGVVEAWRKAAVAQAAPRAGIDNDILGSEKAKQN